MKELDTTNWQDCDLKCPKCGEKVRYQEVESYDGGHGDTHCQCVDPSCRFDWWIDGLYY